MEWNIHGGLVGRWVTLDTRASLDLLDEAWVDQVSMRQAAYELPKGGWGTPIDPMHRQISKAVLGARFCS